MQKAEGIGFQLTWVGSQVGQSTTSGIDEVGGVQWLAIVNLPNR